MHIHLMRVQDTPSQRTWWIKGDNGDDDLMKFRPKTSKARAIRKFEARHDCKVTKLYTYKGGVHRPSEAAMTTVDIMQRHEKKED